MSWLNKALERKAEFAPESGYNLVGLDDFGPFDEQGLYLIAHFPDESEAVTEKTKREVANPGGAYYVYGPKSG